MYPVTRSVTMNTTYPPMFPDDDDVTEAFEAYRQVATKRTMIRLDLVRAEAIQANGTDAFNRDDDESKVYAAVWDSIQDRGIQKNPRPSTFGRGGRDERTRHKCYQLMDQGILESGSEIAKTHEARPVWSELN
jgi:hypothetical protein